MSKTDERFPTITAVEKRASELWLSGRAESKEIGYTMALDEDPDAYPILKREYAERAREPEPEPVVVQKSQTDLEWEKLEVMGHAQVAITKGRISFAQGLSRALETPDGKSAYAAYRAAKMAGR